MTLSTLSNHNWIVISDFHAHAFLLKIQNIRHCQGADVCCSMWIAASALIWEVIEYANQMSSCRALYLHVIAYNRPAIMFYQKNMFQCLRRLHNFYTIEGQNHDAFLYVFYVNGGRSPCTAMYVPPSSSVFSESLLIRCNHIVKQWSP